MPRTGYVYLGLYGDFDPVEISSLIGLSPDRCVAKRSKDSAREIPKTSILRYAQTETNDVVIDVYELAETAVSLLEPELDAFLSVINQFELKVTFQVVLDFPKSEEIATPAIGFSSRVVEVVAALRGAIDVDTYRI